MQIKRKSKKDIEDMMLSAGISQEAGRPFSEITKAELIELLGAAAGGYRE